MFIFAYILLVHSISGENEIILSNKKADYTFNKIGFYSIPDIKDEDEINVLFSNYSYRLFLFSSQKNVKMSISIDGTILSSPLKVDGLSIDAFNNTNLKFILNEGTPNNKNLNKIAVNLWILPIDLCPKSSIFGVSGKDIYANIMPSHFNSYSICAFNPIFESQINNFKIQFGIELQNDLNNSFSFLYSNDFNHPEKIVNGYDNSQYYLQKNPYFIKYVILKHENSSKQISYKDDQAKIIFKKIVNENKSKNSTCKVSAIYSCTSSNCQDENSNIGNIDYKCVSLSVFIWTTSSNLGVMIAVFILNVIFLLIYCFRQGCLCNDEEPLLNQNPQQPLLTPNYTQDRLLLTTSNDYLPEDNQPQNYAIPEGFSNYANPEGSYNNANLEGSSNYANPEGFSNLPDNDENGTNYDFVYVPKNSSVQ